MWGRRDDATGAGHPPRQTSWTISAVIPVHNRSDLIQRAIASVLEQRRPPDEVIVVDDGSTDETAEVVGSFGGLVTLVRQAHGGVSSARNAGVARSRGDFVAFLDSDDYWEPEHLFRIEQALHATRGIAGLYFTDIQLARARGGGTLWTNGGFSGSASYEVRGDGTEWMLRPRQPAMMQSSVIRRDAYLSVGGCAEALGQREDTHLFLKLGIRGPVCAVEGVAGVVTADAEISLTRSSPPTDESYLNATTWLYGDVLRNTRELTPEHRRVLVRRLARAHWDLARVGAARSPRRAFSQVMRALWHDPAIVAERLDRFVSRLAAVGPPAE